MVMCVACIWEMPGLDLSCGKDYYGQIFYGSQSLQANAEIVP
jgi:hypothetical protein